MLSAATGASTGTSAPTTPLRAPFRRDGSTSLRYRTGFFSALSSLLFYGTVSITNAYMKFFDFTCVRAPLLAGIEKCRCSFRGVSLAKVMCLDVNTKADPTSDTWVCSGSVITVIAVVLSFRGLKDSTKTSAFQQLHFTCKACRDLPDGKQQVKCTALGGSHSVGSVGRSEIHGRSLTVN